MLAKWAYGDCIYIHFQKCKSLCISFISLKAKHDIAFFEVNNDLHNHVMKWRGRILLHNIIAYFFYLQKDYGNALRYTFEAQSQAVE
jgi:hypothetical protein